MIRILDEKPDTYMPIATFSWPGQADRGRFKAINRPTPGRHAAVTIAA